MRPIERIIRDDIAVVEHNIFKRVVGDHHLSICAKPHLALAIMRSKIVRNNTIRPTHRVDESPLTCGVFKLIVGGIYCNRIFVITYIGCRERADGGKHLLLLIGITKSAHSVICVERNDVAETAVIEHARNSQPFEAESVVSINIVAEYRLVKQLEVNRKLASDDFCAWFVEELPENLLGRYSVRRDFGVESITGLRNVDVVTVVKHESRKISATKCSLRILQIPDIFPRLALLVELGIIRARILRIGCGIFDFLFVNMYISLICTYRNDRGIRDNAKHSASVRICGDCQIVDIARSGKTLCKRRFLALILFQKCEIISVAHGDTAFDIESSNIFLYYSCPIGACCRIVDDGINLFAEAFHEHVCAKSIRACVVTAQNRCVTVKSPRIDNVEIAR